MNAPPLPAVVAPPSPFPAIVVQSLASEPVAPGVRRGRYAIDTANGPLVVTVVAVDLHEPTVRIASVVAHGTMISSGETVSSMARRTGAVAGVNADYFDIGQTNQPLGIVIRDGALLRTPSKRVVLDVRTDRSVHFENVTFAGALHDGPNTIPLTSVNEWPPQGGAALLTPAYGNRKAYAGVDAVALEPLAADAASLAGAYRVTTIDVAPGPVSGPLLGFGPAARALGPVPAAGDVVRIDAQTMPALETMTDAVGGGPLLLHAGAAVDDPNAPAPEETNRRFPVSGAGVTATGTLLLVAVDGRAHALSIGLTRPEFGALFQSLGATDAMAFDSGGSATLVARVLGESAASVLNTPSDGEERVVADGLFIYSDTPIGPPAKLVARPSSIVALAGASVDVALALVDASGHPVTVAHPPAPARIAAGAGSHVAVVSANGLRVDVPVDVVDRLTRLDIATAVNDPEPHERIALTAVGGDALGRRVALGDAVRWSSDGGTFVAPGLLEVPTHDVRVVATVADSSAVRIVHVGHHREVLAFATAQSELTVPYDFTTGRHVIRAPLMLTLPGEPRSFTVEVNGDANGAGLRAVFVNAFGERRALTLARTVDWTGWRTLTIALPGDLNPPVSLASFDVVNALADRSISAAGSLVFRRPSVIVAGTR